MKKKSKEKKPLKKIVPAETKQMPPQDASAPAGSDDKPFDFGGIPDRDLKKNLGCG